jgi:nicotinate-nucleotide adenylyltransferase
MTKRLGIFGGTFDPPHIGHQILGQEALYQLQLDEVLWILTPDPPHKKQRKITALSARLDMLQAAIAECDEFHLSRVDIDRPSPHYAVDTVQLLQQQFPQAELVYLMGGDSLHDLPIWYEAQEFVAACHSIGVMRRPGDEINLSLLEIKIPAITHKIRFVDAPLLEIAASQIRSRIRQGKPFRYYLPESVYRIIEQRKLYQEDA